MAITASQVASLRARTGISMIQCKKALEECDGDEEKSIDYLRKKGEMKAQERADRDTAQGTVGVYIHSDEKLVAMVKVGSETDFVAKSDDFKNFAKKLAMHIAAANPMVINAEDVDSGYIAKEKEIALEQLKNEGKNEDMIEKIWGGKEQKLRAEVALMEQELVMEPGVKVKDSLTDLRTKMGENIQILEFSRISI